MSHPSDGRTRRTPTAPIVSLATALLMTAVAIAPPSAAFELEPGQTDCTDFIGVLPIIYIGLGQQPTAGDDVIIGTPGDDIIAAGAGNDLICGGGGNDAIWGQGGNDLIFGGPGDDKLRGGDGNDWLFGGDGVDDLNGGRGNDIVQGEAGADNAVRGGTGDDYVTGGPGDDLRISGNGGMDFVAGGLGDDALISGGPRPDELHGGPGNDLIKGLGGADRIFGDAGNDELRGGEQPDLVDGGGGADICNGGAKDDRAMNCETLQIVESLVPDALEFTSTEVVPCPIPGLFGLPYAVPTCTRVTVPEDDTNPANGRTIDLMVAHVDNGNPLDGAPIVSLAGGPGASDLDSAPFYTPAINGFPYDILFVDQRGIGDTAPSLDCLEVDAAFDAINAASPDIAESIRQSTYAACAARLRNQGVDMGMFNTEQVADDLELIRRALGYGPWTLWGSSYGSRLALTSARDHPEGVRAMVIDAIFPIEVDAFGTIDPNFIELIDRVITTCAAQAACATAYGDLGALLNQAVIGLDTNPQIVQVPSPGGTADVYVDGSIFLFQMIFSLMYRTENIPEVPRWISLAATGDVTEVTTRFTPNQNPTNYEFSEGMHWAVMCQDEAAVFPLTAPWTAGICETFSTPDDRWVDKTPASSPVPTLVMSGAFDPITPAKWGEQVSAALPNATFAEFTRSGHGSRGSCFVSMFDAFVSDPTAPVDVSCADEGPPIFNTSTFSALPDAAARAALPDGDASWAHDLAPLPTLRPDMTTDRFLAALRAD